MIHHAITTVFNLPLITQHKIVTLIPTKSNYETSHKMYEKPPQNMAMFVQFKAFGNENTFVLIYNQRWLTRFVVASCLDLKYKREVSEPWPISVNISHCLNSTDSVVPSSTT